MARPIIYYQKAGPGFFFSMLMLSALLYLIFVLSNTPELSTLHSIAKWAIIILLSIAGLLFGIVAVLVIGFLILVYLKYRQTKKLFRQMNKGKEPKSKIYVEDEKKEKNQKKKEKNNIIDGKFK